MPLPLSLEGPTWHWYMFRGLWLKSEKGVNWATVDSMETSLSSWCVVTCSQVHIKSMSLYVCHMSYSCMMISNEDLQKVSGSYRNFPTVPWNIHINNTMKTNIYDIMTIFHINYTQLISFFWALSCALIFWSLTPWIASSGVIQMSMYTCSNVPIHSLLSVARFHTGRIIRAVLVNMYKPGYWLANFVLGTRQISDIGGTLKKTNRISITTTLSYRQISFLSSVIQHFNESQKLNFTVTYE